jgi:hypothetical protein
MLQFLYENILRVVKISNLIFWVALFLHAVLVTVFHSCELRILFDIDL